MQLKALALQSFRKFQSYQLELDKKLTVLVGQNASGKTSLIEAIFLAGTGESFRAGKIDEMISFDAEIGRVKASLVDQEGDGKEVEILLTRGVVQGKRTAKRLYSINQVRRRKKDAIGQFLTVVFRPEDMRLVEGSPSRRRQFLDLALSIKAKGYSTALNTYEESFKKRNKLLFQIREGQMPREVLSFWTSQVIKYGEILQKERGDFLNQFVDIDFPLDFQVEYQPSIISQDRIDEYLDREIAVGRSLIGPHKDDFVVKLKTDDSAELNKNAFDVAIYGSRGQQRMAVLWLKFCELSIFEQFFDKKVILLLDDILSELDEEARAKVLSLIGDRQTIVSTADMDTLAELRQKIDKMKIIKL